MTVPEGWEVTRLEDCAGTITSGATPKVGRSDYYGGGIPFLKIDDITQEKTLFLKHSKTTITEKAIKETAAKIYPSGTILMTMYGTIGEVGITTLPMAANQAIAAFIDLSEIEAVFLAYLLRYEAKQLAQKAGQTTQANISGRILKQHEVVLPPLPEQKKIAEIISSVDEAIQATRETIEQTKRVKKGLLQELLTRGIGHTRFKRTEIGEIPEEWGIDALEKIIDLISGQHILTKNQSMNPMTTPYLTGPADFPDGNIKSSKFTDKPGVVCSAGDILLTVKGSGTGSYVVADQTYCISRQLMALRAKQIFPGYLVCLIVALEKEIAKKADGIIPGITRADILNVIVPLPPLPEQKKIAEILSSVDERIQAEQTKMKELEQVKRGLMQDLLTGKVRV